MKTLNNTVIKNLNPEMGKKIIEKYKADGWDVGCSDGGSSESNGCTYIYYGVINGFFNKYSLEEVQAANAKIIELEEMPKRGDEVFVWDNDEGKKRKKIFLTYIEGAKYPVQVVSDGDEENFRNGKAFGIADYKHFKPINSKLEELKKKYAELGEEIKRLEK